MNIRRIVLVALIAIAGSVASANAQNYNWAGFYGGVHVGGMTAPGAQFVGTNLAPPGLVGGAAAFAAETAENFTFSTSDSVPMAGAQIGYNWRISQAFVAGFEADISKAYQNSHTVLRTQPFAGFPGFTVNAAVTSTQSIEYFGTVRARFGYVIAAPLLMYATAGLAYAQTDTTTRFLVTSPGTSLAPPVGTFGQRSLRAGYTVGGGFEYALARNVSLKGEGLFYDLGKITDQTSFDSFSAGVFVSSTGIVRTTTFTGAIGRIGFNYLF